MEFPDWKIEYILENNYKKIVEIKEYTSIDEYTEL